jgi:hypothetical protein
MAWSITREMIRPTLSQSIRVNRQMAVLSITVAIHAIKSSKSELKREPGRAKGTASTLTPCVGHTSRRNLARSSKRADPKSRCRQVDGSGRVS